MPPVINQVRALVPGDGLSYVDDPVLQRLNIEVSRAVVAYRADLADAGRPDAAAGMMAFNASQPYPEGTVGHRIKAIISAIGAGQPWGDIEALLAELAHRIGHEQLDDRLLQAIEDVDDQVIRGREYATPVLKWLIDSVPLQIVLSGDSTTNGDTAPVGGRPWEILPQLLRHRGIWTDFEVVNAGHSGHDTSQWLSTHLAADMAANPNVYVFRWALNDVANGLTSDETIANVAAGLATFRATLTPQECVVLLMSPNACDDEDAGRTMAWNRRVARGLAELARHFQCVFIDTGKYLQDASIGVWINEDYEPGSGLYVHPLTPGNQLICGLIAEALFPSGAMQHLGRSNMTNQGYPAGVKAATDALDAYDFGFSICPADSGFPHQGVVHTVKQAGGFGYQVNWPAGADGGALYATRLFISPGVWTAWAMAGSTVAQALTLANGWVEYSAGDVPYYQKVNGKVCIGGLIKSGMTTNGTVIATLPAGFRPVRAGFFPAPISGAVAQVHIATDGVLTIYGATAVYLSLEGISFPFA